MLSRLMAWCIPDEALRWRRLTDDRPALGPPVWITDGFTARLQHGGLKSMGSLGEGWWELR